MNFYARRLRAAAFLLVAAAMAGCATLSQGPREPVSIGMSAREVRSRLGPPAEVRATSRGQIWEYVFPEPCARGHGRQVAKLEFGESGRLEKARGIPGIYFQP